MQNMALSKADKQVSDSPVAIDNDREKYPYGLELSLDEKALSKLGVKELPKVGTKLMLEAKVVVGSVRESERANGRSSKHMGLQITDMELSTKSDDAGDEGKESHADKLYGGWRW